MKINDSQVTSLNQGERQAVIRSNKQNTGDEDFAINLIRLQNFGF